jgi:capsule polysaccharide export protein KpsE/RkpR
MNPEQQMHYLQTVIELQRKEIAELQTRLDQAQAKVEALAAEVVGLRSTRPHPGVTYSEQVAAIDRYVQGVLHPTQDQSNATPTNAQLVAALKETQARLNQRNDQVVKLSPPMPQPHIRDVCLRINGLFDQLLPNPELINCGAERNDGTGDLIEVGMAKVQRNLERVLNEYSKP